VEPFLDNMAEQFAAAHVVMARSGASTVAELAAAGKPALLIPFAASADGHQRGNAEVMAHAGAAVMIEESQLGRPEIVLETLRQLFADPAKLQSMGEAARNQAHPGAAERIADRLITLIRQR